MISLGPFWICATLVFTTAISGNLADYIAHAGDYQWTYDFHKGLAIITINVVIFRAFK